jgi:Raf kinase inhibitor-like YbhB/YbcL family protein
LKLFSNDFQHENFIPHIFTCDGDDLSPHLAWKEVPPETKSFALIVDDPDAPGGTWVHWLIADISADTREIPRGTVPKGAVQVVNDFGKLGYGGPCPPGGTHRYFFKLYALDTRFLKGINERNFYETVENHKLAVAILMGKYTRV